METFFERTVTMIIVCALVTMNINLCEADCATLICNKKYIAENIKGESFDANEDVVRKNNVKHNDIEAIVEEQYPSDVESDAKLNDDKEFCSNVILNEGDVSNSLVNAVNNYYMMIPENVRNNFVSAGWTVRVTTQNLGQLYDGTNRSILGLTFFDKKIIYIDDREAAKSSVIHEMGHYIDYCFGFVSSSNEFVEIYNSEVEVFKTIHTTHSNNIATAKEYFAEAYQVSILRPQEMIDACPRTYEFVMRYSNNL